MRVIGAALMADVSNSTPLFEQEGERRALRTISDRLDALRKQIRDLEGLFLHSKGDDVLAFFDDADAALEMAKSATARNVEDELKVHAGLSWGSMLLHPDDLHGTPVNLAARLAALAKPHEVLVHQTLFDELSDPVRETLREVDVLSLKGSDARLTIYSHVADDKIGDTVDFTATPAASGGQLTVSLNHQGVIVEVSEGEECVLGRAMDGDVIVSQPWVSRLHATVSVVNGIAVLKDCSTLGTFVQMDSGREVLARRGTVTLIGNGRISLGAPLAKSTEAVVEYTQSRSRNENGGDA